MIARAAERRASVWLRLAALSVLVILPAALRLAPIRHGLPRDYVPDTHLVNQALGMARDKDPVPPVGRYSTYPNLLAYALLPVYAGQYALGRATGEWSGAGEYGHVLLEHPERAHLPARILFALIAACAPWLVFRAAREAGLRQGAWCAARLCATGLAFVLLSTHERPWAPLVTFVALAMWLAVRHVRTGALRDLVLCAAACGLAFATHQAGGLALVLAGAAWAVTTFAPLAPTSAPRPLQRFGRGVIAVAVFVVVALLLGYPFLLVHGRTPSDAISGSDLGQPMGPSLGGQGMPVGLNLASIPVMLRAFLAYDPVLLACGLVGAWSARRRRELWPVLALAAAWTLVFTTNRNAHLRYLLPLAAPAALLGGLALERLVGQGAAPARRLAAALLLAFPLVQATRLDVVLAGPDTRAEAELRLFALPVGSKVAIDRYGPDVPLDRASLEELARLRAELAGREDDGKDLLRAREGHRLALLEAGLDGRAGPGVRALRVEDLIEFPVGEAPRVRGESERSPLAELRARGCTHLLVVERERLQGALSPWSELDSDASALWVIDPAGEGGHADDARLPTETEQGLFGLWRVGRPGPRLELVEL